jgi:catechol 2,3-dioxygenase
LTGDIAHVGPVELRTPVPDQTVRFFVEQLGLSVVEHRGASILVRTWDDYQRFTLRIIESPAPGIGRTYLRAMDEGALQRRVAAVHAAGLGGSWQPPLDGLGAVYAFDGPGGHAFGLYFDVAWHQATPGQEPALKNQAAPFPGRGDSAFAAGVLQALPSEQIVQDDGTLSAIWYHVTNKSYDLVWTNDWTASRARLHHIAFAADTRDDILRAADVCLEAGVHIETGPHKHAVQQTFFLYVWEPGGNRIELCNAGARLILAPDWPVVTWTQAERAKGQAWGLKTIETFHTHGTPPLDETT